MGVGKIPDSVKQVGAKYVENVGYLRAIHIVTYHIIFVITNMKR